jgi:molecular chaperone HtpG
VARGALDLGNVAKPVEAALNKSDRHFLNRAKRALKEKVQEVRSSERLKESAACLVLQEGDIGRQLQELLKAAGHAAPDPVPSLELNLAHPLVRRLAGETDDERFERLALLLFEQATLAEGRLPEDPGAFVGRLNRLLLELGGTTAEPPAEQSPISLSDSKDASE